MSISTQKVYTEGDHKAIVTRLGKRKWYVARGYSDEVKMSYDTRTCSTQRMAIAYVNDWLADARPASQLNEQFS